MLKQILFKLLNKEIEQIKDRAYKQGYIDGGNHFYREQNAERLRVKEIVMKANIGKKVIYTSNEWEDPTFAIIEGLEAFHNVDGFMYKARDVLNNQTVYFFEGTVYLADEKMVDCVLKLDPFERWNIKAAREHINDNMWSKWYPPQRSVTDPVILKQRLKEVNFI